MSQDAAVPLKSTRRAQRLAVVFVESYGCERRKPLGTSCHFHLLSIFFTRTFLRDLPGKWITSQLTVKKKKKKEDCCAAKSSKVVRTEKPAWPRMSAAAGLAVRRVAVVRQVGILVGVVLFVMGPVQALQTYITSRV
ncbi:hypothetical protein F2P81_012336 [Scophthalmus maximus]|uniref:Uncharacterized protein n=1 Tax=Scophthalmus maximus TaxID=52904 RepID=A0A6A4SR33_SCOMX|nr:hypothetical protein F2P81_012336 [Scophthalmus maximus]